ncbi:unnamed protein product, partial [Laminaria digitata]
PIPATSDGGAEASEAQTRSAVTDTLAPQTKSDQMLVLELTEELRKKEDELDRLHRKAERQEEVAAREVDRGLMEGELGATTQQSEAVVSTVEASAAAGEDILSGAYAKREADSSLEIEELRGHLEEAKAKAHKAEKEKKGLVKMWEAARARLDALEGESGGSATETDASGGSTKAGNKSERVKGTKRFGGRRAGKAADGGLKGQKKTPTDKDAKKTKEESSSSSASAEPIEGDGNAAQTSDDDDDDDEQEDIMTKAMRLLEEDCRKLRVEK